MDDEEITVFGDGTQTRDFTFVDDVVAANILAAATNEIEGEVFNVGGGSRITVNKLIKRTEEITGREAKVRYMAKQKGDVRDTWADVSKAKEELGWTPMINIYKGLEKYMKWYKRLEG